MFAPMWPSGSRTVLLVPRDAASTHLDADFLHQPNIRLLIRRDVEGALDAARRVHPTLIVREIDPSDRQADFYRRLKAERETAAIPLIIVATSDCSGLDDLVDSDAILRTPLNRQAYFDAVRRFVKLPQRRHRRHQINLRVTFHGDGLTGQAFTRDLSMTGALLKTDRLVPDGARVSVTLHIPGEPETGCEALVHRSNAAPGLRSSGLAIEFVGLTPEASGRLEAFIAGESAVAVVGR